VTTTGALPTDDKLSGQVERVLSATAPKATLVELICKVGTYAFNWSAKFIVTLFELAVIATDWVVKTGKTFAVNWAPVPFIGIHAEVGATTAALFVERVTSVPPIGAGEPSVTVQTSLPPPVNDTMVQEIALNAPGSDAWAWPVPLRVMMAVPLVDELLERVNCPETAPAAVGLN
jgi:hypothetical protein